MRGERELLVFERPPVPRIISVAAVCASAALVFNYIARNEGEIDVLPFTGLILLFLGTLAAAIVQYGDHIYVNDEGVMYENTVLRLLGRPGRLMRWDEVVEIREIKQKMLILFSRDGRRLLVDAIVGYPFARAEILRRAPHATLSGTLPRDDR
jgi:hypothetical protein